MELEPTGQPTERAAELMTAFAERTGLSSSREPRRYLWTDAFAVCNFISLRRIDLALLVVDQVHRTLGRYRSDDARTGWISGLSEAEGALHPTRGGLRIGKPLPERRAGEPFDEDLEWERDGQYFHYLTRWMHALDQLSRATGAPRFNLWARELAEAAYGAFTVHGRMVWKMSVDLSRPLVSSMGHHDPLDGYITCAQLRRTAVELDTEDDGPTLERELYGFDAMVRGRDWHTTDPLGLGGLLCDAYRVHQLLERSAFPERSLRTDLVEAAHDGVLAFMQYGDLRRPPSRRLGFRELGLAIGLHAAELMGAVELQSFARVAETIEDFWLDPKNRQSATWLEHLDINEVMLATSLSPRGYLVLAPPVE